MRNCACDSRSRKTPCRPFCERWRRRGSCVIGSFDGQPIFRRQQTTQRMAGQLLQKAFDGAIDQLVQSVLALRKPTADELSRLEELIAEAKSAERKSTKKESRS